MRAENKVVLRYNEDTRALLINYECVNDYTEYEVSDVHGTLVKTGTLYNNAATVKMDDASNDCYVVLVQDGVKIYTNRFFTNRS